MGGGSTTTSSSSTKGLPAWLTGAYKDALPQAQGLLSSGLAATGAGPSMLGAGMNAIGNVDPSAIGAANGALTGELGGGFMHPGMAQMGAASPMIGAEASGALMNPASNPWLSGMFQQGLQGIQNNVDSQFGAAGRNVLAGAPVQASQAGVLANDLYGGQYGANLQATQNAQGLASGNFNTGVGQFNQAAGMAPGITQGMYMPGQELMQAGQMPYNLMSSYLGQLGGLSAPFGTASGTQTVQNNPGGLATFGGIMSGIGGLAGGFL